VQPNATIGSFGFALVKDYQERELLRTELSGKDMTQKNKSGRWPKGKSGNPAGRPRGSRNKATILLEQLFAGEAEALGRKAIELGKQGQVLALKMCLDRINPPPRSRTVDFELRNIETMAGKSAAVSDVLKAISEGQLTPEVGENICKLLELKQRVLEESVHAARRLKLAAVQSRVDEVQMRKYLQQELNPSPFTHLSNAELVQIYEEQQEVSAELTKIKPLRPSTSRLQSGEDESSSHRPANDTAESATIGSDSPPE
jgi:hypothetical protein